MRFLPRFQTIRRMGLLVRQNFAPECEKEINRQINMELNAMYEYMTMACHFNRSDEAMPNLTKWLRKCCNEEKEHAEKLMNYLNMRGGVVVMKDIEKPKFVYSSLKKTMVYILDLEKKVNESLLQVHAIATEMNDPNMCDFLESEFLQEQVRAIKEIADYIRQIDRCEKELGIFMFDVKFDKLKSKD